MRRTRSLLLFFAVAATFALPATMPAQTSASATEISSLAENVPSLSADRLILIFREHPDLMAVARNEFEASTSGDNPDLSDTALLQHLRTDARLRARLTATLIDRGLVNFDDPELAANAPPEAVDDAETSANPSLMARDVSPSRIGTPRALAAETGSAKTIRSNRASSSPSDELSTYTTVRRAPSPYENMPALRDLYAQLTEPVGRLGRFGLDVFQNAQRSTDYSDVPVGPDYVVGSGDSLRIDIWGSVTRRFILTVDREGRVSIPEVGTVLLSGKTLAQARLDLEQALSHEYRNARSDVSLTRIRTVRIYVVGNVAHPGAYELSSLSTVLNAICMAGGPTRNGSIRRVRHLRGATLLSESDLYDLLLKGVRGEAARLEPGDTILVPSATRQVAISGAVRHPAIYELKDEQSLEQVIALAGGVPVSGSLREIKVERIQAHQQRLLLSVPAFDVNDSGGTEEALRQFHVEDGDRITIGSIAPYSDASVYLEGHVTRPGKYPYRAGMKLTDVIPSYRELMPEPSDHAEIVRLEQPDWRPKVLDFELRNVLAGKESVLLQPFDTIRIYSRYAFDPPKVTIRGEVLRPGEYPMGDDMTATDLVRMAGGFKRSAFIDVADLVSYSINPEKQVDLDSREIPIGRALHGEPDTDVRLKAGDVLTIRQIPGWTDIGAAITISGEVQYPGTYGISPGERLSSVIRRAGGFREAAYPLGAVLTREQVKEIDEQARNALVHRIESANPLIKSPGPDAVALNAAFTQQQQQILKRLREQPVSGRQVIHISTDIAEWENKAQDVELRAGDALAIPKKPTFVAVQGQVNSPSAITYSPGRKADWYLKRAGGTTEFANSKAMFIVRADGSVIGQSNGFWNGGVSSTVMQPGDTVVVPEKIITDSPTWRNLLSTAQMASSLAIAARVVTSF